MSTPKKGGGIVGALWAGTAFFAASKAKTYAGFLKSFALYSLVVIAIILAGGLLLSALGFAPREGFIPGAFGQCPNGAPKVKEGGQFVCKTEKGSIVTTEPDGLGA